MTDREYIRRALEENKKDVSVKTDGDFLVLKYKKSVFYRGEWNEFLRVTRGLVLDSDYNIVSLPFHKVHNYGVEADAPVFHPDESVFASRKVNGFMAAATWYKDRVLWSTTGSVSSDFCRMAESIVEGWSSSEKQDFQSALRTQSDCTFLFECVHQSDPHIVPEIPGLHFLGRRLKKLGSAVVLPVNSEEFQLLWGSAPVLQVETWNVKFSELQRMSRECHHEGFCFTSADGLRSSKIKSPHYLSKKMLMRSNFDKLSSKHRDRLDEEFFPLWELLHQEGNPFKDLDEVGRRQYIEQYFFNGAK